MTDHRITQPSRIKIRGHRTTPAKRVAVLVKRFPRLSETFILNEFLELRRQGLAVDLFAIRDPHESRSQPEALALVPEVTYLCTTSLWKELPRMLRTARRYPWGTIRATGYSLTRHTLPAIRNLFFALVLVDRLGDGPPAHLHAHFMHAPAAIAFLAHKINGQPYSMTGHAKDIYTTLPENVQRRCRHARFVTTCTDANRRFLVDQLGLDEDKVHLCRHGVDLQRFTSIERAPLPGRILSIGRLVPKKGFDVLVRASGELHRRGVSFQAHVIGGGDLRPELEELAGLEGVADRIRFFGSRPQADLLQEFAEAEAFALAPVIMENGDRDGIPNVLLEALASGIPVIASAVSGIPEIIIEGVTGRLVPERRPDLLASVLADVLADADQRDRLAASGREFVLTRCGLEENVRPLKALFETMLETSPASVEPRPVALP